MRTHTKKTGWKQVKQNRPFPRHNTENHNKITSTFFEPLYEEGMASNNSENADFVLTPSN